MPNVLSADNRNLKLGDKKVLFRIIIIPTIRHIFDGRIPFIIDANND